MIKRIYWYIKNSIRRKTYTNCSIADKVSIDENVILNRTEIGEFANIAHHAQLSNTFIGKRSSIGRYTKIQNTKIGKYCSISWDVTIGAVEHPVYSISTHAFPYRTQFGLALQNVDLQHNTVNIGNDVWIGCGAIIMPGVTINDGAIIGAGAVVTNDVSAYEIVAGVPARHMKYRFSKEIIQSMSEIKWWDFSDEIIIDNISLFSPNNKVDENVIEQLKNISVGGKE